MQERNEQLAERLRTAEQARDLLVDLERRLKDEDDPDLEHLLTQLDRLAQSLPEADRVRWFVESGAGSARARQARKAGTDVSRSRSAIEGEISTLRGTLKRGITQRRAFGRAPHQATPEIAVAPVAGSAARAVPGDTTKWMPGPAHSFVEVLIGEHGTMLGLYAGEDEIIREIEECPVRPVKWNEGVTGRE